MRMQNRAVKNPLHLEAAKTLKMKSKDSSISRIWRCWLRHRRHLDANHRSSFKSITVPQVKGAYKERYLSDQINKILQAISMNLYQVLITINRKKENSLNKGKTLELLVAVPCHNKI
jgi:hypothetical protein